MATFKCKMCGGALNINDGATVCECEYCGTKQTLPKLDNEKKNNLYDRANHFRRSNDYDKAAGIYNQILNEDPSDAESYWSLVLCRYGIEYVEDPATHKRIPTINRAQYTSIFADENYKAALEYADTLQQTIYEEEAKTIDDIQKGILDISRNEEPFDVFICYKETDDQGRRTPDSVLATDLYHQLTKEGFKVFFSRITLEDKLGTAYEPYIFAALNSAPVMVAVGTRPEYFNSVWVKNEWARYLALIGSGEKKMPIPAYRDMDPYDLPEEFSHLQAQDMGKLGFMQDLVHGIKKILGGEKEKEVVKYAVATNPSNTAVASLLERVFIFLDDGKWQDANEYCEKVLDTDPKNAEAYLGKLMAELHVKVRNQLGDCENPFDEIDNYQKVLRFGDEELVSFVTGCNDAAKEKIEYIKNDEVYQKAAVVAKQNTKNAYTDAAALLKPIDGFKDSHELIEKYTNQAETIRLEKEKAAEERSKKTRKVLKIAIPALCACIAVILVLTMVIIPNSRYKEAKVLYESGQYEEAIVLFEKLDGYKDSNELLIDAKYCYANFLYEAGQYKQSIKAFKELGKYKDSADKASEIYTTYCKEKIKNAEVGDIVQFGAYEQDNDETNGKENIEWIVLEKTDDKALLISDKALDCTIYNNDYGDVTWATCSLRKWLNDDFLNAAFSKEEQKLIMTTEVSADKNPDFSTDPGKATSDKVFLLSIKEAEKYFDSDGERICGESWWLRSPGGFQYHAAYVDILGGVDSYGCRVLDAERGVRPALWVNF